MRLNNGMTYSTTFTYPDSPHLLPHWQHSDLWCGPDSEELYKANCQERPPGWTWENKPVRYTWNSVGYRAPQWEAIDWPNTHVIMGCSHVLGVGIDDGDTMSAQLSLQLDEPAVNLGYCGGSTMTIQYNSLRMLELGWRPKTVTIVIPELTRLTWFDEHYPSTFVPHQIKHGARNNTGVLGMYQHWLTPSRHAELYGRMAILSARAMWDSCRVPVIMRHATHGTDLAMAPCLAPRVDSARDVQTGSLWAHAGPATNALWAREIADAIRTAPPIL